MFIIEEEGFYIFIVEMLECVVDSLFKFGYLKNDDFVVFFEFLLIDDWIVN